METPDRPWYKKKRYIAPIALVALFSGASAFSGPSTPAPVVPLEEAVQPAVNPPKVEAAPTALSGGALSNDNHYTNVDGNSIHSPAKSSTGCAAVGASAECRDGSCSFSAHRQGTCSHHGGVAEWL